MNISLELLEAKRKQAIDERDRYLGAANGQVGRIAALDDLIAVFKLPTPPAPTNSSGPSNPNPINEN
jgi:hypothetical protein